MAVAVVGSGVLLGEGVTVLVEVGRAGVTVRVAVAAWLVEVEVAACVLVGVADAAQLFGMDAELRGTIDMPATTAKSRLLLSVSWQPPTRRAAALVVLNEPVGPSPS